MTRTIDDVFAAIIPNYLDEPNPSASNAFSEGIGPSSIASGDVTAKLNFTKDASITMDHGSSIAMLEGGSIAFTPVSDAAACVATLVATAVGNIDNGSHSYYVTFVNAAGQTALTNVSNSVTVDASNKQVTLSNIPLSASATVTARKIYRSKAGTSTYFLLATISDTSTTTYTDNIADASLTGLDVTSRVNDTAGRMTWNGLQSFDVQANNAFVGTHAGDANTTGNGNTGFGGSALQSVTTGSLNTAVGNGALLSATTSSKNTAVGLDALRLNVTGTNDVAVGYAALKNNTDSNNTAVGYLAMTANTSGSDNTAIGTQALKANTIGTLNCAIGENALVANTTGSYNTATGFDALSVNVTGANNTAVGYIALGIATGSGNVALGYLAGRYETGSDSFYINNQDRTNSAGDKAKSLLYGIFDATAANQRLRINGNVGIGGVATATSPLNITGLPTAAAGLATGDVWSNGGVLTIV